MATKNAVVTISSLRDCLESGKEAAKNGFHQQALEYYQKALEGFKIRNDVEGQQEVEKLIRRENEKGVRLQNIQQYTEELQALMKTNDTNRQEELKKSIRCEEEMILGDEKNNIGCDKVKTHIYSAKRAFQDAITHYKQADHHSGEATANRNVAWCLTQESLLLTAAKFNKEADRIFALCGNP